MDETDIWGLLKVKSSRHIWEEDRDSKHPWINSEFIFFLQYPTAWFPGRPKTRCTHWYRQKDLRKKLSSSRLRSRRAVVATAAGAHRHQELQENSDQRIYGSKKVTKPSTFFLSVCPPDNNRWLQRELSAKSVQASIWTWTWVQLQELCGRAG